MIGKLKGRVDALLDETVILDVGGVGYEVWCPARILSSLEAGTAAEIWIETVVREDMIRLYGFSSNAERDWFRMLQQVQGVGAKVAMAVLGVMKPSELANAIALGDKAALSRAPGVGKRVAERLAIELKDKVGGLAVGTEAAAMLGAVHETSAGAPREAVSALVNLGYGQGQAAGAVAAAARAAGEGAETAVLIRLALKELAR
ncbi:MAG: Holliday junction branch migration protein RuvA [Hyphomicrobiaceae bacterium]|nr:Holliday junction branch migration protein RuvA [Hyphomicrobiaceae bacterium]